MGLLSAADERVVSFTVTTYALAAGDLEKTGILEREYAINWRSRCLLGQKRESSRLKVSWTCLHLKLALSRSLLHPRKYMDDYRYD